MSTLNGYLSRAQYLAMASKMSPLPPEMRALAYDAFEEYLKKRRKHNLYDVCDVVFHLFSQRATRRHSPIDKLVIDEVQDLTMAELALLHDVASHKDDIFVCGDTAQTISRGVGFRFTDVRSLFDGRPKLEQLLINYRTHSGILSAANTVVTILMRLFPNTLDRLASEQGHFSGPPPALLPDTSPERVAELMLSADDVGLCEMGANQVVIVRSEESKKQLPLLLQSGLVLTVEESKGLEFDDVCVYNFFADSPRECVWLVINACDEGAAGERSVAFDLARHQILCEELKMLYVALTRARKRCFVFDTSTERRSPLFGYLSRCGVAELGLESLLSVSATKNGKSTAKDWLRQGDNLYANRLWEHAEKCFLKGGDQVRALEAGCKRLCAKALKAPKEARAAALHAGAVAFMCLASHQKGPSRATSLTTAARVWCHAATAATAAAAPTTAAHYYTKSGEVLRNGLGAVHHRDALACFVSAAEQCPQEPRGWENACGLVEQMLVGRSGDGGLYDAHRRLLVLARSAASASPETLFEEMAPLLDEFSAAGIDWSERG